MATYLGFSTYQRAKKYRLTDFELVKQDIFNHFYIRKGEKLMNPNFGTVIWSLLHEPFTDSIRNTISDDVKTVINYDPRVAAEEITVTEFNNGIQIEVVMRYLLTDQVSNMAVRFDRDSRSVSVGD